MTGNDGLNTLASLCNKESMSNEASSHQLKSTPSRENSQSSQNETGAQARTNMFQSLQGVDPSMMSLFNSLGGQNHSQQMQNLLAAQLMESKRNSLFQQPSYVLPNQQPLSNLIAQNLSNTGSFPTGYDSMAMNALLLATQQGKLQNQNQKHDRGNNIHESNTQPNTNTNQSMKPPTFLSNYHETIPNLSDHSIISSNSSSVQYGSNAYDLLKSNNEAKKDEKRAANRKSAQLSRKRKKLFIEELKEENDDLRRKEQILRSIPDLVIVFDTAGTIVFVSPSVVNVLDFSPTELVNTSFWSRLCEDSVRLLKAAFMDALANRKIDQDTSPLGSGLFEIKVKDKHGVFNYVSLNGVVHFTGETPECVCSIRPLKSSSPDLVEKISEKETTTFALESDRPTKKADKRVESGRVVRHGHSVAIIDADSANNSAVSVSGSD